MRKTPKFIMIKVCSNTDVIDGDSVPKISQHVINNHTINYTKIKYQIIFLFILNLFTIYAILVGKVMRVKKPLCAVAGALMIYGK